MRRVGSIAIVHETLSQAVEENVDFDEIADRLGAMVTEVERARRPGARCAGRARFGVLPSETATALAMVLTELLQNAVEHGYAGRRRRDGQIVVTRRPDRRAGCTSPSTTTGRGCPTGFDLDDVEQPGALDRAARWWSPSCGGQLGRSGRGPDGAAPGRRSTCPLRARPLARRR